MNYFSQAMSLLSRGVLAAGALYTVWGIIQLGSAIKDHNGPGMQNAIFQTVGGAIITAAGAWITSITM